MQGLFQDEPEQTAAHVLLDGFNDMVLDYAIPPGMSKVTRGCRVEVPLRNRTTTGTVIKLTPNDIVR